MSNQTVPSAAFAWDKLIAGDAPPLATDRITIKSGQGVLLRGTALGQATLSVGAAVAGVHTGTETVTVAPALAANAIVGAYKVTCTSAAGAGTWQVINPKGARLADATGGVAYSDQIAFTIAAGGAVGDVYTITVASSTNGLQVSDIADGINAGGASLPSVTILAGAIAGLYRIVCTAVVAGVGTFSVTGPGGALAAATQAVAYTTQIGFTIPASGGGVDPPVVGDSFEVLVTQGVIENLLCSSTAIDGSQTLYAVLLDDSVDTTSGDVQAAVAVQGKFNRDAVIFAAGDSWANHVFDKQTILMVGVHP